MEEEGVRQMSDGGEEGGLEERVRCLGEVPGRGAWRMALTCGRGGGAPWRRI